jgi:hypothetical protein
MVFHLHLLGVSSNNGYNLKLGYTHLEVWLSQYISLLPIAPFIFSEREDFPLMVFFIGSFCLSMKVKNQGIEGPLSVLLIKV